MKYAYVQILKPYGDPSGPLVQPCFEILEYFDTLEEIQEIHEGAPYQERYIIIQVFSFPQ